MILDIIKGFYPYLGIFALIGIGIRLRNKTWTVSETFIICIVLLHLVLMAGQMRLFADEWKMSRRYLLPVAPLIFGWSACVFLKIAKYRWGRWLICFIAIILLYDSFIPALKAYYRPAKIIERKIVERFSDTIRKDYQSLRYYKPKLSDYEYRSPVLPVVQTDFPALGYYVGGQFIPMNDNRKSPDYLVKKQGQPVDHSWMQIQSLDVCNEKYILWKKKQEKQVAH